MKLFLGVPVDAALGAAAATVSRELQARVTKHAPHARAAWVPSDRFHLTVLFIGHVDDAGAGAVRAACATALREAPFDLGLEGVGAFPAGGSPRVLWIGVAAGREAFIRLQRAAYERVAAVLPLEPEREAQPHLTLARVKEAHGLRTRTLLEGLGAVRLGLQRVEAVTLFQSRPVRGGVEYVPLMITPLTAE